MEMITSLHFTFLALFVIFSPTHVLCDICSESFCQCTDSEVSCHGENTETLELSSSSFTFPLLNLSISNVETVTIKTDTFSDQEGLKQFTLENIGKVVLEKFCYSSTEMSGHITHFKMENVKELHMENGNSFDNFPQCSHVVFNKVGMKNIPTGGMKLYSDTMRIENCDIGQLNAESVYSDSQTFIFINNKIDIIKTEAFSGSNNKFNFSDNDIKKIESNAISVAFLSGDMSRNTFHTHTGTPLRDVGPEPVCMPDPTAYYEDTVEYKIVATPAFTFQSNYFPQFNLELLDLPGAMNVPLGSLEIRDNILPCDCQVIKELAILADFDHLEGFERNDIEFGDSVFKKEFYFSSVCVKKNGENMRLPMFARKWLEVSEIEDDATETFEITCANAQLENNWIP